MDKHEVFRWVLKGIEAIAAITGILYYHKWKNTFWRWLSLYLLFIVAAEFTGMYLRENVTHQANVSFYSFIVRPVTFLFFYWIFYKYDISNSMRNKVSLLFTGLYLLSLLADYLYFQHEKYWVQSFSFSMGTVLLLGLLLRFFINFVFRVDILNYKKDMMFWFAFSLFIYYLGTFPFFALRNTLASKFPSIFDGYWYVQMTLSCFMYLLFAFSFIWAKPKS